MISVLLVFVGWVAVCYLILRFFAINDLDDSDKRN